MNQNSPEPLTTSGVINSQTLYAREPLKIGDLVELESDGEGVKALSESGVCAGVVIAISPSENPQSVCVLREGRVWLSLADDLLKLPSLTYLKATTKGWQTTTKGDWMQAYIVEPDNTLSGKACIELFYPPLIYSSPVVKKKSSEPKEGE